MSAPTRSARAARPRTAIIGAGRLAAAIGTAAWRQGYPIVAVASRRSAAARRLARLVPPATATIVLERAVEPARLILLAVPDGSIAVVARDLAARVENGWSHRTVLHHAGSLVSRIDQFLHTGGPNLDQRELRENEEGIEEEKKPGKDQVDGYIHRLAHPESRREASFTAPWRSEVSFHVLDQGPIYYPPKGFYVSPIFPVRFVRTPARFNPVESVRFLDPHPPF